MASLCEVKAQNLRRRLKIVNGCANAPMWIAHIAGGGTIPDPQNVRIDPGFSHNFVTGQNISATRYWPKMGCDIAGDNCALGGSGGPGQGCVARTPDYTSCAPPIDSKFEATWGKDGEGCDPSAPGGSQMEGCDYVDMSLVDGFTLPFTLNIDGRCVAAGKEEPVDSIDCSRLSAEICPENEVLSALGQTVTLRAVNPKTNQVAGCYSPCKKLTDPKWDNVWGAHADDESGVSKYCCPTPPEEPDECRRGPIKDTKWLDIVHGFCPGVYGYAYDDGMGLLRCDSTSMYTVTFFCPQSNVLPPVTAPPVPMQPPQATEPVAPTEPPQMNPVQTLVFRIQSALGSLRSRLTGLDATEPTGELRKELANDRQTSRWPHLWSGAALATASVAAALLLAAWLRMPVGRCRTRVSTSPVPRGDSQDDEGSMLLMHGHHPARGV